MPTVCRIGPYRFYFYSHEPNELPHIHTVYFTRDSLVVDLVDGRTISAPLTWYPKLLKASPKERSHWEICGGGYGIHWPELDEDLSVEGLLRGSPTPLAKKARMVKKIHRTKGYPPNQAPQIKN